MATLKYKNPKRTTKKNVARTRQTRKYYHGGRNNAPVSRQQLRNDIKLAAETLDASIINLEQRKIVKKRLQILYGTTETWKKLRRGPNGPLPNSANYENLPLIVKGYVQALLDRILALFNQPHVDYDYTFITLQLIRYNLFHKTQDELNDENSNSSFNNSTNYSNNQNSNSNSVNNVMPMSNRNSNRGSANSDPK